MEPTGTNHRPYLLVSVAMAVIVPWVGGCEEQPESRPEQAVAVEVWTVQARRFERRVYGIGSIRPAEAVDIRPEIPARVRDVAFKEGASVEEGQVLYRLDDEQIASRLRAVKARLTDARSQLEYAQSQADRLTRLRQENAATADEYDQAVTALETARATVDRLQAEVQLQTEKLADATIRAPLEGRIARTRVDEGDYVQPGTLMTELVSTFSREAAFAVPGLRARHIRLGQTVKVRTDVTGQDVFEAVVTYIAPQIDPQTRSLAVKAVLKDVQNPPRFGASVSAEIVVDRREDRPYVPERALVATRDGYGVYVVGPEKTAERRKVQIGIRRAGIVEIADGLSVGQTVIVAGQEKLSAGRAVRIVEAEDGDSGSGQGPDRGNGQ